MSGFIIYEVAQGLVEVTKDSTCPDDKKNAILPWLIGGIAGGALNALLAVIVHKQFADGQRSKAQGGRTEHAWEFVAYDPAVFILLLINAGLVYWWWKTGDLHADGSCDEIHTAISYLSNARTLLLIYYLTAPCIACCAVLIGSAVLLKPEPKPQDYGTV